jgi:hypothetical protein
MTEGPCESAGIETSAFQGAWFGRRLFGRQLRVGRQIGGQPVTNATFQRDRAIALSNQAGDDMCAGELVGIRIVHDDLPIARQRQRSNVAPVPNRTRKSDSAVLVGILQTSVDDDGRISAVEPLLEVFL